MGICFNEVKIYPKNWRKDVYSKLNNLYGFSGWQCQLFHGWKDTLALFSVRVE